MKQEFQSLLCLKINVEYNKFKKEQLALLPEEIYGNAYQIQCYMCIYESLLEMSQNLSEDVLVSLIAFPELLACLFEKWLKVEDSSDKELDSYLHDEVTEIYAEMFQKEGGLVA